MVHKPIETVAEARRRAKKRLPEPIFRATIAGNEKGVTLDFNTDAFDELGLMQRIGTPVSFDVNMNTRFMGQDVSMPIVISPAGVQAIDPEGEVPVARASAKAGLAMGHSNFAASSFKDVAAANPKAFFQLYWSGSRDEILHRINWAKSVGARGLILTMDALPQQPRDWGSPDIPAQLDLNAYIKFAPMGLSRPAWLLRHLLGGGIPDLRVPNFTDSSGNTPTMVGAFVDWISRPLPSWDDVRWLRENWDGPLMVKGVLHPDDARQAIDSGATAISVSNHGGNNLDSTPASIRVLPAIVDAVKGQVEIAMDSGIRRGGDVAKALAFGADVVMIGRAWIWGLAAGGERGVSEVIDAFNVSLTKVLLGLGIDSIHDLQEDMLHVPDGFKITDFSRFNTIDQKAGRSR